ncbi:MAG: T9SS type A sorting domain-containing protein [Ignavibacteriaceae bacterium]|nr:T9SS type A sorting domain-containing protein [Ignavibacteriaceae bacterium]
MRKVYTLFLIVFFLSVAGWAQNAAETSNDTRVYTQAEKERLDMLGQPPTNLSGVPGHTVSGIVKWSEGFENATFPPTGWAVHNLDAGLQSWVRYTPAIFGTGSASVRWESSSLANNDWLVTHSFPATTADKLYFYATGSATFVDSLIVYVSTTGGVPPAGYTRVAGFRPLAAPAQRFEVSLAAFNGQTIYVAFHYPSLDQLRITLDSVYVEETVPNDVATISHTAIGSKQAGVPFTPEATVKNLGSATQTFNVTMTISPSGYTSTKTVTGLAADQTSVVVFDSWTPTAGAYVAKAFTQLVGDQNTANDTITGSMLVENFLFDNGPYITGTGGAGGNQISELVTPLNVFGFGNQLSANNYVLDDFTVPANEVWQINAFQLFTYQTGSTLTNTINDVRLLIYDRRPNLPGAVLLFGDETTNRFASGEFSGVYRVQNTTPTNNQRPIMKVNANATVDLPGGTYWAMWTLGGTLASGPWQPPVTILGTLETGDAWQRLAGVYAPIRDSVAGAAQGYAQGAIFKISGAVQVIPVELTSFAASVNRNDVTLTWGTATETNNMGFEVERKSANGEFVNIGMVGGHGTTTEPRNYIYTDANVASGSYTYRLKQVDFDGTFEYSSAIEVDVNIPAEFSLAQNYPNPFNPSTTINFALKVDSKVSLRIFDALGQEVKTLLNDNYTAGVYNIDVNASALNSGVYFYTLEASGVDGSKFAATKKMILMK